MPLRSHGRPVSDCCRLLLLNSDHWFLNSSPKLLLDQRKRGHQLCQQLGRRLSRYLRLCRHFGCYLEKSSHYYLKVCTYVLPLAIKFGDEHFEDE